MYEYAIGIANTMLLDFVHVCLCEPAGRRKVEGPEYESLGAMAKNGWRIVQVLPAPSNLPSGIYVYMERPDQEWERNMMLRATAMEGNPLKMDFRWMPIDAPVTTGGQS